MFENKVAFGEVYYTRIIASWINEGGESPRIACRRLGQTSKFEKWLGTLKWNGKMLTDDEIKDILELATNGKMEFEHSAREFIKQN